MPIKNRLAEMHSEITAWRRDFHMHPELNYDLPRTSATVAGLLRSFGCDEVVEGIGQTGVVGVIRGKADHSGKVVGLRADMDALPIEEESGVEYTSKVAGKMHACGHDGHTAMLLGAAKYLCETRNFNGTAVAIFQPAEEGGAGAKAMIDDGLMDRFDIQEVYGLHNMPGIPAGHIATRPGPIMASADLVKITVTGKGGHAGIPHETIDTTLVAAQMLVSMNTIVSRSIDPLKRVVISMGTFETDSAAQNIIANRVVMEGSVRSLDEDARVLAEQRIREVVEGTAAAFGATAELEYERGYPVTSNDPKAAEYALAVARSISAEVDDDVAPIMPSEDFSFMLNARPGAFVFLGNGDSAMLHHPSYVFDDEIIPVGSSWLVGMIEGRMPSN